MRESAERGRRGGGFTATALNARTFALYPLSRGREWGLCLLLHCPSALYTLTLRRSARRYSHARVSPAAFDLVTHVWDCFLCEGWKIVYRVALTFVRHAAPRLFKMDFEKLMDFFKNLPSKVDGRLVMERAFDIKLKQRHVNHCYTKYDKLNPDVKAMLEGAEIATEEKRRAGLLGKLEDMEDNVVAEEEVVEEGEEKGEGGESSSDRDLLSKTSA